MVKKIWHLIIGALVKFVFNTKHRDRSIWVFGEWFGERCGDNCTYLANYVASHKPEIQVFWVANEGADTSMLFPSVNVLIRGDKKNISIFKKAGAVFLGQGFKDLSCKGYNYFGGAVTVLIWHGLAWKYIGHDGSSNNGILYSIYVKLSDAVYGTEYGLSPSTAYDKICQSAFHFKDNQLIKAGLPRNSVFYDKVECAKRKKIVLNKIKWNGSTDVKIITYMPTFRDSTKEQYSFESLFSNAGFREMLINNNWIVIQKAHQVSINRQVLIDGDNYERFFILNNIDAQSLLCSTDLLVTDYSSCFFDYAILKRPIIHFLYDYDYYKNKDRGLYFEKEDVMFGVEATNETELLNAISDVINNKANCSFRDDLLTTHLTYEGPNNNEAILESVCDIISKRY